MGKMSENNFVERFCHKYFQKHPKKGKDEILKELTHLYLNGRKLEEIVCIKLLRTQISYKKLQKRLLFDFFSIFLLLLF